MTQANATPTAADQQQLSYFVPMATNTRGGDARTAAQVAPRVQGHMGPQHAPSQLRAQPDIEMARVVQLQQSAAPPYYPPPPPLPSQGLGEHTLASRQPLLRGVGVGAGPRTAAYPPLSSSQHYSHRLPLQLHQAQPSPQHMQQAQIMASVVAQASAKSGPTQHRRLSHHQQQQQQPQQQQQQHHSQVMSAEGVCELCGKAALYLCSTCRAVWYCSQGCQTAHWSSHAQKCEPKS